MVTHERRCCSHVAGGTRNWSLEYCNPLSWNYTYQEFRNGWVSWWFILSTISVIKCTNWYQLLLLYVQPFQKSWDDFCTDGDSYSFVGFRDGYPCRIRFWACLRVVSCFFVEFDVSVFTVTSSSEVALKLQKILDEFCKNHKEKSNKLNLALSERFLLLAFQNPYILLSL